MKLMDKSVFAFAVFAVFSASAANTWYVDDDNYNADYSDAAAYIAAGLDGTCVEKAFGTIQIAIDNAQSDDTIYVAPGEYAVGSGSHPANDGNSRIGWKNKRLLIYSTHGADKTFVVGRKSNGSAGIGDGAFRCLTIYDYQDQKCGGTIIKGFTFRDGATAREAASDNAKRGGAVYVSHNQIYFADCVFKDCSAPNGAAAWNGTFVRCLFVNNICDNSSGAIVAAVNGKTTRLYASVFHHNAWGLENNSGNGYMFSNVQAVNCTVIDNAVRYCSDSANDEFYNTLFFHSGDYGSKSTYSNCITENDELHPIMSTLIPDVRLLPQSKAIGAGDASHLSHISLSDEIGYKDFGGNDLNGVSGAISIGATQTVGTPVAGGIAVKDGATTVNGGGRCRSKSYSYVFPDVFPTQYLFSAVAPAGQRLSHFRFEGSGVIGTDIRFPMTNDTLWVMPPSNSEVILTNTEAVIRDVVYVKPDADTSVADGSEDRPYRTIQAAVNANPATVIVAKPGVYAEDVTNDVYYGNSRLSLSKTTRITSEAGAEHTVILGESQKGDNADAYGRGPDAVRCIFAYNCHAQVQGFTLTGGRTASVVNSSDKKAVGGAIYCTNTNPYFYLDDCIVTNNSSSSSGVINYARMTRCHIADNPGSSYVVVGGACCGSTVMVTAQNIPSKSIFDGTSRIVHSTVVGDTGVDPYFNSSSSKRYACVFLGGNTAAGNGISAGNVVWNYSTVSDTSAKEVDPLLADAVNGDLQPLAMSPVFDADDSTTWGNYENDYWFYATTDCDGNPVRFVGRKPIAGAFMTPTDRSIVAVSAPNSGVSPSSDRIEVEEGDECVLSVGNATRPIAGICVNGVTNFVDSADWTCSISAEAAKGGILVSAIYTNVWYAAVDGDDSKSGFFPEEAKSLQGALANAYLRSGDRVIAMPGTYGSGEMIQDAEKYVISSRAVVPSGVTLESKGGRDATVIAGKKAETKDAQPGTYEYDVRDLGLGAVRCVYLESGASLKGFTLTNGWTRAVKNEGTVSHGDADTCGGGVYGASIDCVVEDCRFIDNGAFRGAGAYGVLCKNSIFEDNFAYYGGGASSDSRNHGCVSKDNEAAVWSVNAGILAALDAINCTIFDSLSQGAENAVVTNTVVAGTFYPTKMQAMNFSHCVFNKSKLNSVPADFFEVAQACEKVGEDRLVFDGYRPTIGQNACVDTGTGDVLPALGDCDLSGGQRIYNGCIDVGALEADWRSRYGRDISSRLEVLSASPAVVEFEGNVVRLPEGASLGAKLAKRSERGYVFLLRLRVSADGMAELTVNGETQSIGEGDFEAKIDVDGEVPLQIVATSGTVDILKSRALAGMAIIVR